MSRTISRGVEYAYDDFCISTLARGMGYHSDAQKYLKRSGNWQNNWKADHPDLTIEPMDWQKKTIVEVTETHFTGFPQPRLSNGTFTRQNTRLCSHLDSFHSCYYDTPYDTYEGSPWLYQFFVPQDMNGLIRAMGGNDGFVERLTYFHESGIAYIGNEQAFLPVFQFHYAGRPGLSSYWAHRYIPSQFNATMNGIPGNDDCAMGAFSAFVAMGFFPVAGQDVYLLTAPFFKEIKIRTKTGKKAVIRTRNFDPDRESIYIQSAKLNGKPYHRNWITHDFFINGGVLEYRVGKEESEWGTLDQDVPPSYPFYEAGKSS
jgi:putative alpha-1,2-mannosidase